MTTTARAAILVAEDDPDDRLMHEEALADGPGAPRFVEDGEELLDYLLRQGAFTDPADAPDPRLIVLDLNMPRLGGLEALRRIKAHPRLRQIPIVVLTTSSAEADVNESYDLGANGFVNKPDGWAASISVIQKIAAYWLECVRLPRAALHAGA
jgi:CheY-like chemotaxis protein